MKKTCIVALLIAFLVGSAYLFGNEEDGLKLMREGISLFEKAGNPKKEAELRKAIRIFEEVFEKYPKMVNTESALMYMGICYDFLGEVDNAIRAYTKATENFKMKGFSESTYYYLADAYRKKGDIQNAIKWYKACIEMCKLPNPPWKSPAKFPYRDALEALEQIQPPKGIVNPEPGIRDALYQHYVLKDYANAKKEYERFFESLSNSIQESSEILKSGIRNYYRLLSEMNLTEEFGPRMRSAGIKESFLSGLIQENSGSGHGESDRKQDAPETGLSTGKGVETVSSGDLISLDMKDFEVARILELIRKLKKVSILYPKRFSDQKLSIQVKDLDFRKALHMIAQMTRTTFFESGGNFIFEDLDDSKMKKQKTCFIKNMTLSEFQTIVLDKLDKEQFRLLSVAPQKNNSLTADFLITPSEGEKLDGLINTRAGGTYTISFKVYEFCGDEEVLVSAPAIEVNEGCIGEIKVEGKKKDEYSLIKLMTSVRKEGENLYKVKLEIDLRKLSGNAESRSNAKSEFNTTGHYEYVIYDNFGLKKYKLILDVSDKISGLTAGTPDSRQDNSLIKAVRNGHEDVARMLIASGVDVNSRGMKGMTPIHAAIAMKFPSKKCRSMFDLLIGAGAALDTPDEAGETPLHTALYQRKFELAEILISKGCDVNHRDLKGNTPVMISAEIGQVDLINKLIKAGAVIDGIIDGKNPRSTARSMSPEAVAGNALPQGAASSSIDLSLINASRSCDVDMMKMLINSGADLNAKDRRGYNAIASVIFWNMHNNDETIRKSKMECLKLLLDSGADVNLSLRDDLTSLNIALEAGEEGIAEYLVEQGADVNRIDSRGNSPLILAAGKGFLKCIRRMVEKGADIDYTCTDGMNQSALQMASYNGHKEVVQYLLEEKKKKTPAAKE